jgi:outer membrane receptor protein involved in Fe transport
VPFYMNAGYDSSRLMIVYASGNSRVVRFNLSAVYQASKDLQFGASMKTQSFSLDTLKRPYHTPTFQMAAFARASLNEKVLVSAELQYYNGMYARTIQSQSDKKLPGFANLNLKMEYLISDKFSAFVEVDNALNQKNPRFLFYPTRGILFLLGATASF